MGKQKIEYTERGVRMTFDKVLPNEVRRGHSPHKSGAGIHGQRKKVRIRGNNAKRAWLED